MRRDQILKLLKVAMITTAIILLMEIIFAIDVVNGWFVNLILNSSDYLVYGTIWLIMFLQTTILNIPAYVILSASVSVGIHTLSITFFSVVLSAYMCGAVLAYWLGRWFGVRAVEWCAGGSEDYDKWSIILNVKGRWWYFATVIFPLFPDDILCLVAGAVCFNFKFYFIANLIGRGIGLISMILVLNLIGSIDSTFPFMILVWVFALLIMIVAYIILKRKENK